MSKLARRRCYLPTCREWFAPEYGHHFFCHEFCYRRALELYAGSDFPMRSTGSSLMSRDLLRGLWNPLWEERIPGKRYTLEPRRVLTPVRVGRAQPGSTPSWVETIDGGARMTGVQVITDAIKMPHRPHCFCDECIPPRRVKADELPGRKSDDGGRVARGARAARRARGGAPGQPAAGRGGL